MTYADLPAIFSSEEIYDAMVRLKIQVKDEKRQLSDLHLLFIYTKKLLESSIQTAFLAGAEDASVLASELLVRADTIFQTELRKSEQLEGELRTAEANHIASSSKAADAKIAGKNPAEKIDISSMEEKARELEKVAVEDTGLTTDIKVSSYVDEAVEEKEERFLFEDNSEDGIKISVKKDDENDSTDEDKYRTNNEKDEQDCDKSEEFQS